MQSDIWLPTCPLSPDWFLQAPMAFYSRSLGQRREDSDEIVWLRSEGQPRKLYFEGRSWTRSRELCPDWEIAPDDRSRHIPSNLQKDQKPPRHLHATLSLGNDEIHIDHIVYTQFGPLAGFQEYRVFVNRLLRGRGGIWGGALVNSREHWPLAVTIRPLLIIIKELPKIESLEFPPETITVWELAESSTSSEDHQQ